MVTGIVVKRELWPAGPSGGKGGVPRSFDGWRRFAKAGHSLGTPNAPDTMVVFSDFECPACRAFAVGTLASVRRRYQGRLEILYRHWPLSYHPNARNAAVASVCADEQGKFDEFHDELFARPQELGKVPYLEIASRVGVPDTATFRICLQSPAAHAIVSADSIATSDEEIQAGGTPTILVRSKIIAGVPDSLVLFRLLDRKR